MDMIVANDVSQAGLGFGADDNAALLLWRDGDDTDSQALPPQPKTTLADAIVDRVLTLYAHRAPAAHD
jgi:phosphopantothenoylcysteine decarboxylase/phosphopantothenate--cysteine ligase